MNLQELKLFILQSLREYDERSKLVGDSLIMITTGVLDNEIVVTTSKGVFKIILSDENE